MDPTIMAAEVCDGIDRVLVAARVADSVTFRRGVVDSREVQDNDLFFAIPGENADGHDFAAVAVASGAAGVVIERPLELPADTAAFHVANTSEALQALAAHRRAIHNDLRVVGVTGSVGKTTCKEMIAAVLGAQFSVLKSEANLNTEIGIPLTLLGLMPEHRYAVLEMGMYQRGDIALLARIAAPEVGVITNVGPVHLERLGWMGAIVAAKAELVEALPESGLAILNGDDPRTAAMASRTRAPAALFGLSEQCHVRATAIESRGLDGASFYIETPNGGAWASCPLPGRHHVYPALAAATVGLHFGLTIEQVADALAAVRPQLRMRIVPGPNGSTIIDDSYNASPASMIAALALLWELQGRRIAVLGEMRELGAASEDGHRRVGQYTAATTDILVVVGDGGRLIAESAREAGHADVRFLDDPGQLTAILTNELQPGDHVLVKASRAVALESVVEALITE